MKAEINDDVSNIADRLSKNQLNHSENAKWLLENLILSQRIAKIGSWDWDLRSNHVWWSDETYRIFGEERENFIPSFETNRELIHPDDFQMYEEVFEHTLTTGDPLDFDIRLVTKSGLLKYCHVKGKVVPDESGQAAHCIGTIIDITDRKLSEIALKESEERFRSVAALSPDIISILNIEGKLIFNSSAAYSIHGYTHEDLVGQNTFDLIHPEDQKEVSMVFAELLNNPLQAKCVRYRYKNKDGSYVWMECNAINQLENPYIKGIIAISRNIDNQKKLEEERNHLERQLLHSQKLESLGILAGGIAHDFNNILSAVLGYAEMAKEDIESRSKISEKLDRVLEAGNRAAQLVKQILAFSRQAATEPVPLSPEHIIRESVKLLRPSLPSTITIKQQSENSIRPIIADPTQIHQLVMNLCTNAFHAMEHTGGILSIHLENQNLATEDLQQYPNVKPGNFTVLSVSDTGSGISLDVRDRIFDPYFTTKEVGKGTGMGLAIVHGIATSLGGFVTCESILGQGTLFRVYLPAIELNVVPKIVSTSMPPTGKERVLFVDDEKMLAELGKTMLERLGYHVTLSTDSMEALSLIKEQPNKFDVLVTDHTMPRMTGYELARNVLQIRPDMPIILCTGYSNLVDEKSAKQIGVKAFIMKPVTKKELAESLKKVMHENYKKS